MNRRLLVPNVVSLNAVAGIPGTQRLQTLYLRSGCIAPAFSSHHHIRISLVPARSLITLMVKKAAITMTIICSLLLSFLTLGTSATYHQPGPKTWPLLRAALLCRLRALRERPLRASECTAFKVGAQG